MELSPALILSGGSLWARPWGNLESDSETPRACLAEHDSSLRVSREQEFNDKEIHKKYLIFVERF